MCQAFKRKDEAYKLIWPGKAEFVRMAAKFGATIVPFAAIGADEAVTQLLDGQDLAAIGRQLPSFGQRMQQRQGRIPRARVGVNANMEDVEAFAAVRGVVGKQVGGVGLHMP
jgi:hypothetical protein